MFGNRVTEVLDSAQRTKPLRGGPKATALDRAEAHVAAGALSLARSRSLPSDPALTAPLPARLRSPIMEAADGLPVRAFHREGSWP